MATWAHLHLFAAIVFALLAIYLMVRNPLAGVTRTTAFILLLLGIWSFTDSLVHNPLSSDAARTFFINFGVVAWSLIPSSFLLLVALFRNQKKLFMLSHLLMFVAVLVIIAQWSGHFITGFTVVENRVVNHISKGFVPIFFLCYAAGMVLFSIFLFIDFGMKTTRLEDKYGAFLISFGTFFVALGVLLIEIVLPILQIRIVPHVGSLLALVWGFIVWIAILKYDFIPVTPAIAAERLIDLISEGVVLLDQKGRVLRTNNAMAGLLNIEDQSHMPFDLPSILGDHERADAILQETRNRLRITNVETEIRTNDGISRPVLVSASMIEDKARLTQGYVCSFREIAQIKEYQDKLRETSDQLRKAQLMAHTGHFMINVLTEEFLVSAQAATISFLQEEGKYPVQKIREVIHPDDVVHLEEEVRFLAQRANLHEYETEFRLQNPLNREIRWLHAKLEITPDKSRVTGVIQDITSRKEMEEKLFRTERLSTVGHLAAGMAHEFNNLMGIIRGNVQLLLMDDTLTQEMRESLETVDAQTRKGASVISRLIGFSTPKRPEMKVHLVSDIVQDTVEMLRYSFKASGIEVYGSFDPDAQVFVDKTLLQEVITNLLMNAKDAIVPKGRGVIKVRTLRKGTHVHIEIQDDGIGMSDETVRKLFTPFFTTKSAYAKDSYGLVGTGLGLSVSYSLVKKNGGEIRVESEEGVGSLFVIELPTYTGEPEGKKEHSILVVDDDREIVRLFEKVLLRKGQTSFEFAQSITQAKEQIALKDFDLIFLDLVLPDGKGEELISWIKSRGKPVFIVAVTGKMDVEEQEILAKGASAFLTKPFDIKELDSLISRYC